MDPTPDSSISRRTATSRHVPTSRLELVPPRPDDPVLARAFGKIRLRGREPLHMHRAVAHPPLVFHAYPHLA